MEKPAFSSIRRGTALFCALVLSACTAAQSPPPQPAPQTPAPDAYTEMMRKARAGGVRVIVRLAEDPNTAFGVMQRSMLAELQGRGIAGATGVSEAQGLIAADVSDTELQSLQSDPRVAALVEDRLAFVSLAESAPLIGAPKVWALGGRGKGQAVAILDTGVDASHPAFGGRVVEEACFSTSSAASGAVSACTNKAREEIGPGAARPCKAEGCDHGTHVAGIAASGDARFTGVAPEADIIAVQVFSVFQDRGGGPQPCRSSGQTSPCVASFTSDQIRALEYVRALSSKRAVAAANMSLGGGRASAACDTEITKASIDALRDAGVITVIAAGNEGFPDAVSRPGCISSALTVGATSKTDQVADFSNRGPQVDLLAPGVAITAPVPGAKFAALSGTSMAAPHVAGALAGLRSLRPTASASALEAALTRAGPTIGALRRLDAPAALANLPTTAKEPPVMAAAAPPPKPAVAQGLAAIAALPAGAPVRVIARWRGGDMAEAMKAARAAGIASPEALPGQPLLVLEATPGAIRKFARHANVEAIEVDQLARPH